MFQGDSYVIPYQYDGVYGRKYIIYFWLGKDSTQDEQAAAAIYSVVVDRKLNGEAELVRVPQGEEPKHFLKIFNGRLVTLTGGKASGFRNTNQKDTYDNDGVRLFKIYGTEAGVDLRADQVPEEVSSLQSDDVFLLETPEKVYLWYGQGSSEVERQEAIEFVHKILGANTEYEVVRQNEEPVDFWNNLNGDKTQVQSAEQWRERIGKRVGVEPRLFEVDLKSDNTYDFEEVYSFKQR
ncbi:gelsolin, cytoplasmic-like, partial [Hyposmocoma kahamanoa]|uniref:gelsolin, cytoplasmic-like n=1 Tax=Hyposmocoma kahamanoa TaxID=1477025 RepID=UPI000E6D8D73